ncbi:MAG: hypothetical protein C4532_16790 [Candidatus Abyssobacteria bacterium SURF_17]|uniref:Uncharacterized protein n=1 Tax=Candidatus Abyssobacteria bacterium SURF_17 TaxID=2093361 RepID=A0A419ERB4_9BACT|nr:MAG: hypothetical protein C4532_16790 [Candidatus Abyssubacteria bacterium SURF_17]
MKRAWSVLILAIVILCTAVCTANAIEVSPDMEGYFKVGYTDGNTYAVRLELGEGAVKAYILPYDFLYLGMVAEDGIYFSDRNNPNRWGVLREFDGNTALITGHDADAGKTREFSAIRITEEEAVEIAEETRQRDANDGCVHNLKQLGLYLHLFAKDHDGELPYDLAELFPEYVTDKSVFVCPSRGGEFRDFEMDYEYIPGFRSNSPNASQEAVLIEVGGNHTSPTDSYHVLYLDGHVEGKTR